MARYFIIAILVLAAFLRLYGLDRGDTINDEVFYAFRGIGMLDFDKADVQTTPLEWFDPLHTGWQANIPSWTGLSFHDHPPLVFWVEHFFMNIFGDKAWAFRLPSALLGVASVYLVYLIGSLLFAEIAGLLSAAVFAVTLNSIYISRTGMQEPYVIFFMLLSSYFFLRAVGESKPNYFIQVGLALGLGLLSKYNMFIMAPIFLVYLAIYKREYFLNKKLWLGGALAILFFSPVLIYNYKMYQAVGHFDFQLSYVFNQPHPEWQSQPGKEVGSLWERVKNFIPRLVATNSWGFLLLFVLSLFFLRNIFLFFVFGFLLLLLLFIGPAYRFLTMLTPWMALSVGAWIFQAGGRYLDAGLTRRASTDPKRYFRAGFASRQPRGLLGSREESKKVMLGVWLLLPVLLFEIFYSYNNQIVYYPVGSEPWLASKVRYENYNWGYNALNDYLENEFKGKMPALAFQPKYKFLNQLQERVLRKSAADGLEEYPALVVYYGNFDDGPRLWIFDRLKFYHAWPVISFDTYQQFLSEQGGGFYRKAGFKNYYFIESSNIVSSPEFRNVVSGRTPIGIKNQRGDVAFKVYKFR